MPLRPIPEKPSGATWIGLPPYAFPVLHPYLINKGPVLLIRKRPFLPLHLQFRIFPCCFIKVHSRYPLSKSSVRDGRKSERDLINLAILYRPDNRIASLYSDPGPFLIAGVFYYRIPVSIEISSLTVSPD
jgi:hypothetical protein